MQPASSLENLAKHASPSPFSNRIKYTPYKYFKLALFGIFVPIRFLLVVLFLLLATPFAVLAAIGAPPQHKPFGSIRLLFTWPARLCARGLLFAHGYWWIHVKDQRKPDDMHTAMIVSNHCSWMDALFLVWYFGVSPVGKSSLRKLPLVGQIAVVLQTLFVDRRSPDSRHKCAELIRQRAKPENKGKFPPILIFPEGVSTNQEVLVTFKLGAFSPGVSVLPVLLRYPHQHQSPSVVTVGALAASVHLMCEFVNHICVTICPVYHPSQKEKADPLLYANNVRQYMSTQLGVPTTRHSYDDVFLYDKVKRSGIPQDFEMEHIKKATGLEWNEISVLMKEFGKKASKRDATISYKQFCTAMDMDEKNARTRKLFEFFDINDNGTLHFTEFLAGYVLVASPGVIHAMDRTRLACIICDYNCDGWIYEKAVRDVVNRSNLLTLDNTDTINVALTALKTLCDSNTERVGALSHDAFREYLDEHDIILLSCVSVARQRLAVALEMLRPHLKSKTVSEEESDGEPDTPRSTSSSFSVGSTLSDASHASEPKKEK